MANRKILLAVDLQKDFIDGTLTVPGAYLVIPEINKVKNLAWLCEPCHRMVHNGMIPPGLDAKVVKKIEKYRKKLNP